MDITATFYPETRAQWRAWLAANHATVKEIWLVAYNPASGKPSVAYLDMVEEALCFGWIDGTRKKMDEERTAMRFTPRRPKSNWTELNKDRSRRLIAAGLMTDAGRATLPDLTLLPLEIAPDILAALQADAQTWANFQNFPDIYQRIRIRALEDQRSDSALFQQRLATFVDKTRQNKMIGGIV